MISTVIMSVVIFLIFLFLVYLLCVTDSSMECHCPKKCVFYKKCVFRRIIGVPKRFYVRYKFKRLDPNIRSLYLRYMILNHLTINEFENMMFRKFIGKDPL